MPHKKNEYILAFIQGKISESKLRTLIKQTEREDKKQKKSKSKS